MTPSQRRARIQLALLENGPLSARELGPLVGSDLTTLHIDQQLRHSGVLAREETEGWRSRTAKTARFTYRLAESA